MQAAEALPSASLKLRPVLDLTGAGPLRAELLDLRGSPVSVDATDVDRLGALCLQVLLSAKATWEHDGLPFTLAGTSSAFDEALATLGATVALSSDATGVRT